MDSHAEAQGQPPGVNEQQGATLQTYLIGYGFALVLTLASFWVSSSNLIYPPGLPILLGVLAIAQMGVHLVFFLHISSAPDQTNNFLALAFGIFITGLIVFGSMLIMANLNQQMMPMDRLMDIHKQP